MRHLGRSAASALAALVAVLLALATPAAAHVEGRAGPFRLTLGWVDEPALSGSKNYVEVAVSDASGAPVAVRAGALEGEGSFSAAVTRLPLVPAEKPGELRAVIVPTRPGSYAFHVTGTLRGKTVDAQATCSGATFD